MKREKIGTQRKNLDTNPRASYSACGYHSLNLAPDNDILENIKYEDFKRIFCSPRGRTPSCKTTPRFKRRARRRRIESRVLREGEETKSETSGRGRRAHPLPREKHPVLPAAAKSAAKSAAASGGAGSSRRSSALPPSPPPRFDLM